MNTNKEHKEETIFKKWFSIDWGVPDIKSVARPVSSDHYINTQHDEEE